MIDTEASHRKLSDGSSSINLNITSSPIEGGDCSGRGLSKEVKAVEDLVFFYSLYRFGEFHLTFQLEDDGPSAEKPTAVSEDQTVAEETSKGNCMLSPVDSGEWKPLQPPETPRMSPPYSGYGYARSQEMSRLV
ncbi:unnamed protein product [Brassica rapa subsp. narinosa]|uniref:(rape) hypothetical protein n=1 Tax=Brassica napus TaxID=3708 RepID=A0A816WLT0_BRANA|nr:unnamed protein product [Brassica napus]